MKAPTRWVAPLVLVATGALLYGGSLDGPFIYDDQLSIVDNPNIRRLWPLTASMGSPYEAPPAGRPLMALSLAINYALGGLEPRGYRLFNLAMHILCSLALYGVVRRTLLVPRLHARFGASASPLALGCALVWAAHPLQSEVVNYVTQRTESLMALFFLLTLYCALRSSEPPRRALWVSAAIAACALGMLSKQVMVTAPVVVALHRWVYGSRRVAVEARDGRLLYAGLASTWVVLWAAVSANPPADTVGLGGDITWFEYALNQCGVILHYVRVILWPSGLSIDYGYPVALEFGEVLPEVLGLVALVLAVLVLFVAFPSAGFLGVWFFIILSPTSSVVPILTEVGADRRAYLASIGPIVGLVIGSHELLRRMLGSDRRVVARLAPVALLLVVTTLLGVSTIARSREYRSEHTIWKSAAHAFSENARAHAKVGQLQRADGELERSIESLRRAVELRPGYSIAHAELGLSLDLAGDTSGAMASFRNAIETEPNNMRAHYNLGRLLRRERDSETSLRHLRRAVELRPRFVPARSELAVTLAMGGQGNEAIRELRQGLVFHPDSLPLRANLAAVLNSQGELAAALAENRRILAKHPDHLSALLDAAWILATHPNADVRDAPEALAMARRAEELARRRDGRLLDTLAAALANAGDFAGAARIAREALGAVGGNASRAVPIRERLRGYEAGKPYRAEDRGEGAYNRSR